MVKAGELTLDGISQYFMAGEDEDAKPDMFKSLCEILALGDTAPMVVFCSNRQELELLVRLAATEKTLSISILYEDMNRSQRAEIKTRALSGREPLGVLICTEGLARELDLRLTPVVLNYTLPKNKENYIYQVGPGGPSGRCGGVVVNLVTERDLMDMTEILEFYGTGIQPLPSDFVDFADLK